MAGIDQSLSEQQKRTLEEARALGAFHSRTELFLWFADHSIEIVKEAIRKDEDPYNVREYRERAGVL